MKKNLMIILTAVFGIGLILGDLPSVKAQETDEFTLEEITVTAQKREEEAQSIPIYMEVITADDIKLSGKTSLTEILSNLPSAVVGVGNDGVRIGLRGMSDDTDSYHGMSLSMPSVAINVDGVFSNRKDQNSGLYDLERVEVLYGPQSTTYGTNSPGGVINIHTVNPKLDVYEGTGTLGYGNYNTLKIEGAINIPASDKIALRAAFSANSHDGYLSNGGAEEDTKSGRLRGLFQPNDKFSITLTGELTKTGGQTRGSIEKVEDLNEQDDPWYSDDILGKESNKTGHKIFLQMDLDLDIGTLTFIPSTAGSDTYDEMTSDGMSGVELATNTRKTEEKGAELRLVSSSDSSFTWLVAANYYDSETSLYQVSYYQETGEATGAWRDATMSEEVKAIYGNIKYAVTDRFRVSAGYRQNWDDVHCLRYDKMGAGFEVEIRDYPHSYHNPDYKLGMEYDLSENIMTYLDYSTSYRAQGLVGGPVTTTTPPPEKLNAYTAGLKSYLFDKKFQVNFSGYYYDYENYPAMEQAFSYQGTDLENPTSEWMAQDPGMNTWGDGYMWGADLQTSAIITKKDMVNITFSYLKTKWTDLAFRWVYDYTTESDTPRGQVVPIELIALEDIVYTGKNMTSSPKLTINASYKHIFNLVNGAIIETTITGLYKGEYRLHWADEEYPTDYQESYSKLDFNGSYISSDGKWTLTGYVNNITNYADKVGYMKGTQGWMMPGNPRTYGAVLSLNF